jgi:DNA-3-methyladenine glycosylase
MARSDTFSTNVDTTSTEFDFTGPTIEVARRLIGAHLIRAIGTGKRRRRSVIRIVETEAYLPLVDPSCHAYRGPTKRNSSVFGRCGTAYVYFIYGNHFCLNVVTEHAGIGAAVLIRAGEPVEGIETMRTARPNVADARLASGPGNLCRALHVERAQDGVDLAHGDLTIVAGPAPSAIAVSPRIGLSVAQNWPLRFFDPASTSVSATRNGRIDQSHL